MAAFNSLNEIVDSVTECSICADVIEDATELPCTHQFCLKCLNKLWKDKKPGDELPCPLCRTSFRIPEGGLSGLRKDQKMLNSQNVANTNQSNPTCDVCFNLRTDENVILQAATKFCVDCESRMCEQCSKIHSGMKILKLHQIVALCEAEAFESVNQYRMKTCDKHEDKKTEILCSDCRTAVCPTCFLFKHNGHKFSYINEVSESEWKAQIRTNMAEIDEFLGKVNKQSNKVEKVVKEWVVDREEAEAAIIRRGDEITKYINEQVKLFLQKLKDETAGKSRELESLREELMIQKIRLERFMKYMQRVLDEAVPSDIAYLATEVKTRAETLTKMRIAPLGEQIKVSFVPADMTNFTKTFNTGNIGKTSFSVTTLFYSFLDCSIPNRQTNISYSKYAYARPKGMTISDKEIFTIHENKPKIHVFDCETFEHLRTIPVPTLKNPSKIWLGGNSLLVEEAHQNYENKVQVHKIPLNSSELASSWSVDISPDFCQVWPTSNPGNIFVGCKTTNKLMMYNPSEQSGGKQYNVEFPINQQLFDAIQLENNNLLLALSDRVCLVDNAGKLIRTYGGPENKEDVVRPCCLAAEEDGSVVVVDGNPANRIILLNKELTFVKELIPQMSGLKFSYYMSIFMDRYRNRLFVRISNEQRIIVFDLSR